MRLAEVKVVSCGKWTGQPMTALQRKSIIYLMRTRLNGLNTGSCWKSSVYLCSGTLVSLLLNLPPFVLLPLLLSSLNLTHSYRDFLILKSIFSCFFSVICQPLRLMSDWESTQVSMWLFHHLLSASLLRVQALSRHRWDIISLVSRIFYFNLTDTNLCKHAIRHTESIFPVVRTNIERRWEETRPRQMWDDGNKG